MKISFEIIDEGNGRINIHNMLIDGKFSTGITSVLPNVFGRIMGGIVRDCINDPMGKIQISKLMAKAFKKSMEDEIYGTEPMISENLVKRRFTNEHS